MSERNRARRERERVQEKPPEPTWTEAHALLEVTITGVDRLAVSAEDGETGLEAPESVHQDPTLLLAWCERYAPERVVDDETALVCARNRCMSEVVHRIRCRDPKLCVTPAAVIDTLKETP